MTYTDAMRAAFNDELEKIAGMTRIGRPPMLAGTAAAKNTVGRAKAGLGKFFKGAGYTGRQLAGAATAGAVGGIVGTHQLKKMHQDYRLGKAVRKQQEQSGSGA